MSKSRGESHQARRKRGPKAFEKKAVRKAVASGPRCGLCLTPTRAHKLNELGYCPRCVGRLKGEVV